MRNLVLEFGWGGDVVFVGELKVKGEGFEMAEGGDFAEDVVGGGFF